MVVLDYYGFRLVAEAALPVNRKTIVYGSDDGTYAMLGTRRPLTLCRMQDIARR